MNASKAWLSLIQNVISYGDLVTPRGIATSELLAYKSVIDMNCPIVDIAARKLNYRFMFAEAWWILSGSNKVEDIKYYMSNIAKFSDNSLTFRGAYGPKIVEQLDYVVETLGSDIDTRQAVLSIWRENPRPSKDHPCTLTMQWLIRDGKLNCITTMRSSDAWLGWVYDVFNFSMVSSWIMMSLKYLYDIDVSLGNLHLTAGSQHIYGTDKYNVTQILNSKKRFAEDKPVIIPTMEHPDDLLLALRTLANTHYHNSKFNIDFVNSVFSTHGIDIKESS